MIRFSKSSQITSRLFHIALAIVFYTCSLPAPGFAEPDAPEIVGGRFQTPPILRPRVQFWTDVFTKYGKYHLVVHHRHFPQLVFKVLDFSRAAEAMDPMRLKSFKDTLEKEKVGELKKILSSLIENGGEPRTSAEAAVVKTLTPLGTSTSVYKKILDEDLIRTQTGIKERYSEAVERTGRYLPIMERIFTDEFGLPAELTRLPFVESSFDYTAYSAVGAAGIWQFMPGTARNFMTVTSKVDERLDPIIATRAAAQYLGKAYKSLGSWAQALTSYNHGVTGVYRKMKEAGSQNLPEVLERRGTPIFGFASGNFYPEFLASVEIYRNYRTFFPNIQLQPLLRVKDYTLKRPLFLQQVARSLGISREILASSNYALLKPVVEGVVPIPAGYSLRIPLSHADNLDSIGEMEKTATRVEGLTQGSTSSVYGGTVYTVRSGDTLLSISKKYKVSVPEIVKLNKIGSKGILVGQRLQLKESGISTPVAIEKKEATSDSKSKPNNQSSKALIDRKKSSSKSIKKPSDKSSGVARKSGKTSQKSSTKAKVSAKKK